MRAEQGGVVNETLSASFTSVELSSIYLSIWTLGIPIALTDRKWEGVCDRGCVFV